MAKVKRPLGIEVSYFDENGEKNVVKLFDFYARVI